MSIDYSSSVLCRTICMHRYSLTRSAPLDECDIGLFETSVNADPLALLLGLIVIVAVSSLLTLRWAGTTSTSLTGLGSLAHFHVLASLLALAFELRADVLYLSVLKRAGTSATWPVEWKTRDLLAEGCNLIIFRKDDTGSRV